MPIALLFIYIVITVLIGWAAVWLIGYLAPGHPDIIDKLIWVVTIVVVVVMILSAFGLLGSGPMVPRLG